MRGKYAKRLDPVRQRDSVCDQPPCSLAYGEVFPALTLRYQRLAALPAAQLAMLAKGYGGGAEDLANSVGKVYRQAGQGKLPSTRSLMTGLTKGKGIEAMFEGEKAGPRDQESYTNPGYVYGQEPLMLGEAAAALGGLVDAALINEPLLTQQNYSGTMPGSWGSYLIDKGSSKALRKQAGKGQSLNTWVGRRLFK